MMMQETKLTAGQIVAEARRQFREAGIRNAAFEAACLFEKHTGIGRASLPAARDRPGGFVPPGFFEDVRRRLSGEPLQYLLGEWEFMGLRFLVGPGVLIPRADTEILAETALQLLKPAKSPAVLELCFGSGCVGIAAAKMHGNCTVRGLDSSDEALGWAEKNIRLHGLGDRVSAVKGDMLRGPGGSETGSPYDLLVCNPPYIPSGDIAGLDVSVRGYEPRRALDGGPDGLVFYRAAPLWTPLLKRGGAALFEVGAGEAEAASRLLGRAGLRDLFIKKDYTGTDRVVGGYAV